MFHPGLVSITFRQLEPLRIVEMVQQAGLAGIEWGGDVHVPHGNTETARQVRKITEDAGLNIPSYGSYYRVGVTDNIAFEAVVETADVLGAETIRLWAGNKGSAMVDDASRRKIVSQTRELADLAGQAGITLSFEFHGNTLTDTNESAIAFYNEIDHDNVLAYWQPPTGVDFDYSLAGLKELKGRLSHLHVFKWQITDGTIRRQPLSEGVDIWRKYIQAVDDIGGEHYAMIEFVANNSQQQFFEDAKALTRILGK
jgi:3-dehydroshikimate dehydratase